MTKYNYKYWLFVFMLIKVFGKNLQLLFNGDFWVFELEKY